MALLLAQWGDLGEHQHAQGLARFGRLSGIAVGVLVVSGVALADLRLAQPADMFATLYGATLMLKLLLALAAIGLAAWPMYQRIWRWRAALAALVVVVGVAGLLVSLPPP
jgi:copper transport protein